MADGSVLLEVIVEGKNVKIVQRQVERVTDAVNENTAAQSRNTKASRQNAEAAKAAGDSHRHFDRGLKGAAGTAGAGAKNFSKMRDVMGGSSGLVGAYATLAANLFAATAAFGALQKAAQVEQLEKGLTAMGTASGVAMGALSQGLQKATGYGISLQDSMKSVALITSAGFDSSAVEQLGKAARATSIALGRDTADSLDRLVRGVVKLEPELLDELGIMVRLDEASESYARKLGKQVSQLTNFEKRQAFLNGVLEESTTKFGDIGDSVETNPYDQLSASLSELSKTFLNIINFALKPLVGFLAENKVALAGLILVLTKGVLNTALPIFQQLAEETKKLAENQSIAAKKANEAASIEIQKRKEQLGLSAKLFGSFGKEYNSIIKNAKSTEDYRQALDKVNDSIRRREIALKSGLVKNKELYADRLNALQLEQQRLEKIIALEERRKTVAGRTGLADIARSAGAEARRTSRGSKIFQSLDADPSINNYIAQIKRSNIVGRRYRTEMAGMEAATAGFLGRIPILGSAIGKTTVLFRSFSTTLGIVAKGLFSAIPFVGQIMLAFDLLSMAFTGVLNLFKSDETKKLEEKLKSASDTVDELSDSFNQLDRYAKNQLSTISKSAQYYEILKNSAGTLSTTYQELRANGAGDEERLEFLTKAIEKSELLTNEAKKQGKVTDLSTLSERARIAAIEKAVEATAELGEAGYEVSVSAKSVSEELGKFRSANAITTPYTALSKALDNLQDSLEKAKSKGIEDVSLFLMEINEADAKFFNLEAERAVLIQIKEDAKKLKEDIARGEEAASFSGFLWSQFGNERVRRQINADLEAGGEASNRAAMADAKAKEAAADAEKKVAAMREEARINDLNARTKQSVLAELQDEIKLQQEKNDLSEQGITARLNAEANLRAAQIRYNNDEIRNLETEKKKHEKNSADFIGYESKINALRKENALLNEQDLSISERAVELSRGSLERLNEEQKYLKAILDINNKISEAIKGRAKSQLDIQKSTLETIRSIAGDNLSTIDQAAIATKESTETINTAEKEYQLKVQSINLEYALLDAQFELLRAELEVAKEKGTISEQSYSKIVNNLSGINLVDSRAAEILAALSERNLTITRAQNAQIVAAANVTREANKDSIERLRLEADFSEAIGNNRDARLKRERAINLEILQIQNDISYLRSNNLDTTEKEKELSAKLLEQQKESLNLSTKSAVTVQGIFANVSETFYQDIKNTVPLVQQLATTFASAVDAAVDSFVDAIVEGENVFKALKESLRESLIESLAEAAKSQLKLGVKLLLSEIPGFDKIFGQDPAQQTAAAATSVATSASSIATTLADIPMALSNLSCVCAGTSSEIAAPANKYLSYENMNQQDGPLFKSQKRNEKLNQVLTSNTGENVDATRGVEGEVGFWGKAQQYATENVGTIAAAGFASMAAALAAGASPKKALLGGILGAVGGAIGGAIGGPAGAMIGSQIGGTVGSSFEKGGVMSSSGPMPLQKYANGGIARTPQLAMFGEGSRPEAYVPLPDGRSIPVTMSNSGGNTNNISINVAVDGNGGSTTTTNSKDTTEEYSRRLGTAISNAVKQELANQQRPGGILYKGRR